MQWPKINEEIHPYDKVGRKLKNAFGQREIVTMERRFWDYLFWLGTVDVDIERFVQDCDLERGNIPFGDALSCWLRNQYEYRQREGLIQPWWLQEEEPPLLPDED